MDIQSIVKELCTYSDEQEWFEFKENWFQPEALGEYVSANLVTEALLPLADYLGNCHE